MDVLELISSLNESFPLIFLTAAIEDEELAANTILAGATGFVEEKYAYPVPEVEAIA